MQPLLASHHCSQLVSAPPADVTPLLPSRQFPLVLPRSQFTHSSHPTTSRSPDPHTFASPDHWTSTLHELSGYTRPVLFICQLSLLALAAPSTLPRSVPAHPLTLTATDTPSRDTHASLARSGFPTHCAPFPRVAFRLSPASPASSSSVPAPLTMRLFLSLWVVAPHLPHLVSPHAGLVGNVW